MVHGGQEHTAGDRGSVDLDTFIPAFDIRVAEWIPLPCDWGTLGKGKDKHNDRHNIENDTIGNDRHSKPCLGPEEPADQDSNHQLW